MLSLSIAGIGVRRSALFFGQDAATIQRVRSEGPTMFDLIIRNANLPDGRQGFDVGVKGGKIATIEKALVATAGGEIDATGRLLSPPFCDPHFHMDATLSLGLPRMNVSGTLLEGIALWGELRPLLTKEALVERALRYCDLAVSQGLLAIRSHVDTSDPRLVTAEALLEVKEKIAPYIDLQLVAFPQDGYFRAADGEASLNRALDMGIGIVGGIPHFERTMEDGARSVEALLPDRRRPWPAGRHALRRDRRSDVAPHRDAGGANGPLWSSRPRRRFAPDLDAFDGQLLRLQAHSTDGGG